MKLSPQSQAVLLLTVSLGKRESGREVPLSNREWSRLAVRMRNQDLEPSQLLTGNSSAILPRWVDKTVSEGRVRSLLDRGPMFALALE